MHAFRHISLLKNRLARSFLAVFYMTSKWQLPECCAEYSIVQQPLSCSDCSIDTDYIMMRIASEIDV